MACDLQHADQADELGYAHGGVMAGLEGSPRRPAPAARRKSYPPQPPPRSPAPTVLNKHTPDTRLKGSAGGSDAAVAKGQGRLASYTLPWQPRTPTGSESSTTSMTAVGEYQAQFLLDKACLTFDLRLGHAVGQNSAPSIERRWPRASRLILVSRIGGDDSGARWHYRAIFRYARAHRLQQQVGPVLKDACRRVYPEPLVYNHAVGVEGGRPEESVYLP